MAIENTKTKTVQNFNCAIYKIFRRKPCPFRMGIKTMIEK